MAAVQFLLYAADGDVPNYYFGSLCYDHAGGKMLLWLLLSTVTVLIHVSSYKIAEQMRTDRTLAA